MKFALFVAGAALVEAQTPFYCSLYGNDPSNCTTANNCTFSNSSALCYTANATYCDTSSKTCGTNCVAGSAITNLKTCSTCAAPCAGKSSTDCETNPACKWSPGGVTSCADIPKPTQCSAGTSQSSCAALENCFWASVSINYCGQAMPKTWCAPCNTSAISDEMRSGLKNLAGQQCVHAKGGDFTADFSYTISAYAQNSMCNATSAAMDMSDREYVSEFMQIWYKPGVYFDSGSELPKCAAAPAGSNDASALLPSAAFLLAATFLA